MTASPMKPTSLAKRRERPLAVPPVESSNSESTRDCVVFDLDGTLVETEQIWRDVRREFVVEHGGAWRDDAPATMIGMRTSEWAGYIHDDLGVKLRPEEIARGVVANVVERLRDVPVLPGAEAALARLASLFRLGLATSAALPVAQAILARTGWRKFFAVVVSADEVARGKPAPDVYLRALDMLGRPARAVGVEDSANGIRAARAAGIPVIAIPNREFVPDRASLGLASLVLDNLDQLDAPSVAGVMG
jgi:HAD superfamily hydrolase (TIGR01509 family)